MIWFAAGFAVWAGWGGAAVVGGLAGVAAVGLFADVALPVGQVVRLHGLLDGGRDRLGFAGVDAELVADDVGRRRCRTGCAG
ncbi:MULTISPECIES: hypothetical protein [unclassified Nonomuraea]|uniref:hypothetical protein n=1 Tax=unclassified Nonomuraea TaxID=2593643 RepID=UPI0033D96447